MLDSVNVTGTLAKLGEAVMSLLTINNSMTLQELNVFLFIGLRDGIGSTLTTSELSQKLDLTPTATSRIVYFLADGIPSSNLVGLGLVELRIDPSDRRRRTVHLTDLGRETIKKLTDFLAQ